MRLTGGISHTYPAPWVVRDDDSSAQPPRELVHHKSLVRRGEDAAPPSTAALRAPPAISLGHLAASLHHQQAQSNALLHHLHARVDATSGELTLASSTLAAVQNRLAQRIDELERTTVAMQQTQQHQERTLGVHRAQVERRQETTSQQIERIQRRLAMPVTDVPPVAEPTLLPPVVPFVPSGSIAQPLQPPSDASPAHQQRPPSAFEAACAPGRLASSDDRAALDADDSDDSWHASDDDERDVHQAKKKKKKPGKGSAASARRELAAAGGSRAASSAASQVAAAFPPVPAVPPLPSAGAPTEPLAIEAGVAPMHVSSPPPGASVAIEPTVTTTSIFSSKRVMASEPRPEAKQQEEPDTANPSSSPPSPMDGVATASPVVHPVPKSTSTKKAKPPSKPPRKRRRKVGDSDDESEEEYSGEDDQDDGTSSQDGSDRDVDLAPKMSVPHRVAALPTPAAALDFLVREYNTTSFVSEDSFDAWTPDDLRLVSRRLALPVLTGGRCAQKMRSALSEAIAYHTMSQSTPAPLPTDSLPPPEVSPPIVAGDPPAAAPAVPFGVRSSVAEVGRVIPRARGLRAVKRPNYAEVDAPPLTVMEIFTTDETKRAGWTAANMPKEKKARLTK